VGIAQKKIGGILSGRLKTSRTSGGIAARNIQEKREEHPGKTRIDTFVLSA